MKKQAIGPLALRVLLAAALTVGPAAHAVGHHRSLDGRRLILRGPRLRSSEALIYDATGARVLYAKRPTTVVPIASITKLMTTLVVAEAGQPLDQRVIITRADRTPYSRLPVGIRLTRAQLFHLALMSSENRAAHALCRAYPGGVPACVRAMNAKARALGMTHTHFVEPTGLSRDDVSTSGDLAKLVLAASRNPIVRRYSTSRGYTIRAGRRLMTYYPTDPLVKDHWWHIVVQKTGFTSHAGQCLVMDTLIDHHSVIMVLMHSWGKYTRTADARRVRQWLEWGFSRHAWETVASRD